MLILQLKLSQLQKILRIDYDFKDLISKQIISPQGEVGYTGRSQLRLIETLFRDPSDITLPKFSK
jgi:hypothetical protein